MPKDDPTPDAQIIDALGGNTAVAKLINARFDRKITRSAVAMMRRQGVRFRYRFGLAAEARRRGLDIPAGFLPKDALDDAAAVLED